MEWCKTVDRNACAYKEIYEILRIFPQELVAKIPQEKIIFFRNNMDNSYQYNISKETFDGKTMLEETKAILTILFRDYWAIPMQKEKILAYENLERNRQEEEMRLKYNPDNLFKKRKQEIVDKKQTITDEIAIVEYKENVLKKIINKILNIFKFR